MSGRKHMTMKHRSLKPIVVAALAAALLCGSAARSAMASLQWNWNYSGAGVTASGGFVTDATPDANGFYQITGITGAVNGSAITALQATGTAIPGNAGFPVDNLVRSTGVQLTGQGFGFAAANGEYHNPFFFDNYQDYISTPPYTDGAGAEPVVEFHAARVDEPGGAALLSVGLCVLAGLSVGGRRSKMSAAAD